MNRRVQRTCGGRIRHSGYSHSHRSIVVYDNGGLVACGWAARGLKNGAENFRCCRPGLSHSLGRFSSSAAHHQGLVGPLTFSFSVILNSSVFNSEFGIGFVSQRKKGVWCQLRPATSHPVGLSSKTSEFQKKKKKRQSGIYYSFRI